MLLMNENSQNYKKLEISKKEISQQESTNETDNELKALQGILKNVKEQQAGINISGAETKYIKYGNNILLPVILNNAGKTIQVNFLLDTGCSITLLDDEVSRSLGIKTHSIQEATIANGSKVKSLAGTVNLLKVGPINETNFLVTSTSIAGNKKKHYGLLGMNFLEKHPFIIDHNREVIVWR